VTALEHYITTKVKPTGMITVFYENTKLKRQEGKEAAKGVAHSVICRAWVNFGSTNLGNRRPTSAGVSPHPIRQCHDYHVAAKACAGAVTPLTSLHAN
jgi:hypothetical protein